MDWLIGPAPVYIRVPSEAAARRAELWSKQRAWEPVDLSLIETKPIGTFSGAPHSSDEYKPQVTITWIDVGEKDVVFPQPSTPDWDPWRETVQRFEIPLDEG